MANSSPSSSNNIWAYWPETQCSVPLYTCISYFFVFLTLLLSPMQTIQHGLPLARGRRVLCISRMLGQQVVFETQRTPVVTQFTSTVHANNFSLVERTIWNGFETELAIQNILFFIHFCSRIFVSASHSLRHCCIPSWFPKLQSGPNDGAPVP